MENNLQRITEKLRTGGYSQDYESCADDCAILAGEYSFTCYQLEQVLSKKPAVWNEVRKTVKSDTACERLWENMELGMAETRYRLQIKSCEKMMSALKAIIEIGKNELLRTK